MSEKGEQFWSDAALEAAKKAKAEAEAQARTSGRPEAPPPDLGQLVRLIVEASGRGGNTKEALQSVLKDVRMSAGLTFERTVNGTAMDRHQQHLEFFSKRYQKQKPEEAKSTLDLVWKYAEANHVSPDKIFSDPSKLNHSAVAMEMVTRMTTLTFQEETTVNPKLWWGEAARAYASIDFSSLTAEQEGELRQRFKETFQHIRELVEKSRDTGTFPTDDKSLWRGLGDYYFSSVPETPEPPEITAQRVLLHSRLKEFQSNRAKPHTVDEETSLLSDLKKDLDSGLADRWKDLNDNVEAIQLRVVKEIQELSPRKERGGGEIGSTAESRAKLSEFEYKTGTSKPAPFAFTDIREALGAFSDEEFIGVRQRLNELDGLFMLKSGEELDWEQLEPSKLGAALSLLDDIERTHRSKMSPEQLQLIERYQGKVRSEMEILRNREQPVNRIYLGEDEKIGLEEDPIGISERMFLEAMQAFVKDPDGPRAKFLFDRLDLMQYYLFSRQHTKNIEIVIIHNKPEVLSALDAKPDRLNIKGRRATPEEIALMRKKVGETVTKEKTNFERSFNNRLHEVLYIQQWQHASEANDEQFSRFLNTRMLEDDYWGMDGQFGGLLKRFRMTIHTKYEQKLVDAQGNRNAHVDTLWDEAVRETREELKSAEKYPDMKDTWERYLSGEFFTDVPGSGVESTLARSAVAEARGVEEQMSYEEACEMLTQFASFRMIMSMEKYDMDARFIPVRWGEQRGQIATQFLEKQKVVKVLHPFEGWQITWGGITLGYSAEERMMMRRKSEILRKAFPEIKPWAEEWANDWWENRIEKMSDPKFTDEQKKIWWGDLRSVFIFSVDDMDQIPSLDAIKQMPHYKGEKDPIAAWIHDNLSKKKLLEETEFYAGMKISDMINGEFPYLAVFESGARRRAANGALKDLLGVKDVKLTPEELTDDPLENKRLLNAKLQNLEEIAKQNFLTFTELESAQGYFGKKQTEDTAEKRNSFLKDQSFVARYAPHGRLLVLREGESQSLHDELQKGRFGGESGFSAHYGRLAGYHEDIFAELALGEQIDYSTFKDGKKLLTEDQRSAALKVFENRVGHEQATQKMEEYFKDMGDIINYLKPALPGADGKVPDHPIFSRDSAIAELTDIRYGSLLWRLRRDDYPYEYMQNPERALPKLMKLKDHPLYDASYKDIEKANKTAKQELNAAKKKLRETVSSKKPEGSGVAKMEVAGRMENYDKTQKAVNEVIKKKRDWIGEDQHRVSLYWTRVSDRFEPTSARDEQSGLWRRNIRDVGGAAGAWQLAGDAWSLDERVSMDARKKRYKAAVGICGNTVAKLIDLMDEGQRLAIQKVYARYAPFFDNSIDSSDVKKIYPHKKSKLPDELEHEFNIASEASGGKSRLTAPDALGLEYAVKAELGVSNWGNSFGGTSSRYEWLERQYDRKFIGPWLKKHLKKKQLDNAVEWIDHRAPLGVWKNNIIVGAGLTLLFLLIYTLQSAGGEEKKHK